MSKKAIILAGLASLLLSNLASAPAEAATARRWWMRDWNCTNEHKQRMQIKATIIDDVQCDETSCTASSDAISILKWRLVDGAGAVSFRVTGSSQTSVTATDRPDGGDTELNLIVQFKENGHERAAGTMTSASGSPSDFVCTTGSFASLDPLRVKKAPTSVDLSGLSQPAAEGGIRKKASGTIAITKKAKSKIALPDIVE